MFSVLATHDTDSCWYEEYAMVALCIYWKILES